MKAKLKSELKEAMKAKDKILLETIRSLLSEIQYEEMQKGIEDLSATDTTALVQRALKKRQEELQFAEQASRLDLKDKLLTEIRIVEAYLPKQLTEAELETIISKMKEETPGIALSLAMKGLKDNYSGLYDGKLASDVAKRLL